MTQLLVFLVCVALVAFGALSLVTALKIQGRVRLVLACLAACVPIVMGIWLFRSSGLRISDFGQLLANATRDFQQITQNLKEAQSVRRSLEGLLR